MSGLGRGAGVLTRRGLGAAVLAGAAPRVSRAAPRPVVVASDEDVSTLDPHLIRNNHPIGSIVWSVFDSLVRRRPDGSHEPRLAAGWRQTDARTWRFQLRPGVTFHNGETLDAQGVAENLERMNRSPFNAESQLWQQAGVVAVSAPGPLEVELRTEGESLSLLYWLEEAFIGAPRYMREADEAHVGANPVGSGPYRFVEWRRGERVSLTAFDGCWSGPPAIRDVVFRAVPETSSRLAELKAGEADLVPGLNPDSVDGARSALSELRQAPGLRKMHMGLSQRGAAALRDRRVRQAVNHAVDVATIIETLQRGMTVPLASVVNPPNNDPSLPRFAFDPARASALLKEAGHEGFAVEVAFDEKYPDARETCEAVAAYLEAIGVKPRVVAYQSGRFTDSLRARTFPGMYFYGFGALINPMVELVIFTSDAVDNASGYSDPDYDRLVKTASVTADDAARGAMLRQAERMVWADAPWLYLWPLPELAGCSRRLIYEPRPDEYVEIYKARLAS